MAFPPPFYTMNNSRFGEHSEPSNNPFLPLNLLDVRNILFPMSQPSVTTNLLTQVLFPTALMPPTSPSLVSELRPSLLQNYDRDMRQRDTFYVFIKILLQVLQTQGNDDEARLLLRLRAKAIIRECVSQNRSGNTLYQPLMDAIQSRLRPVVGEDTWNKARSSCRSYLRQKLNYLRRQQEAKLHVPGVTAV